MANTPWYTSSDLIESVKRKISTPTYQTTLTEEDILRFCNEEMRDSIIPLIISEHEEYWVTSEGLKLKPEVRRYPIPNRAIGMKLRDVMYGDGIPKPERPYGELSELVRINADDKAYFHNNQNYENNYGKYYIENNEIVLASHVGPVPTGYVVFYYFLRPNQLVLEDRAHVVQNFTKNVTVVNSALLPGDTIAFSYIDETETLVSMSLTAVVGTPGLNEFEIGVGSATTGSNLTTAINNGVLAQYFTATNGTPATAVVKLDYTNVLNSVSVSNPLGFLVNNQIGLESATTVPANITNRSKIDLLQTLPGHKTIKFDVNVPANGVSGNIIYLLETDIPSSFEVGDYVCSRNECIIPQIPPELHSDLAERATARILASQGDREGLAVAQAKINEMDTTKSTILSNRVEGSPQVVFNKNSLLRITSRRRGTRF